MASQALPAAHSRAAPERDGAISGFASPGVQNRVMSALDAHDSGDMPGPIRAREAGVASSSAHPRLGEPLTPQIAWSSSDPTSGSSLHLPFFINTTSASASPRQPSSCLFPFHGTSQNLNPHPDSHADCLPLFSTFYLSPSASRCSGAFSNSEETQSIMPGQTFDAPMEHRFQPLDTTDSDYFPSARAPAETAYDTTELRSHSACSGRSQRTDSPLSFARWARRNHHHHHSNNHNRYHEEESHKSKGRDCGSADRKASRNSPKRLTRSRSTSVQKRQHQAAVPQMTPEEFEALPLAIQRKVCVSWLFFCHFFFLEARSPREHPHSTRWRAWAKSLWLGEQTIRPPLHPPLALPASAGGLQRFTFTLPAANGNTISGGPFSGWHRDGCTCLPSSGLVEIREHPGGNYSAAARTPRAQSGQWTGTAVRVSRLPSAPQNCGG
jgi:hypothetical protein